MENQNIGQNIGARSLRGPWRRGKSGNPGGRPRMSDTIKKLLAKGANEAMHTIIDLSKNSTNEKIKLEASLYLVNRYYGKPVEMIANEDTNTPFVIKVIDD